MSLVAAEESRAVYVVASGPLRFPMTNEQNNFSLIHFNVSVLSHNKHSQMQNEKRQKPKTRLNQKYSRASEHSVSVKMASGSIHLWNENEI